MIFPKFEGEVFGIWDNSTDAWAHDSHGIIHMSQQLEIIEAQCGSMDPYRTAVHHPENGITTLFTVKVIAEFPDYVRHSAGSVRKVPLSLST